MKSSVVIQRPSSFRGMFLEKQKFIYFPNAITCRTSVVCCLAHISSTSSPRNILSKPSNKKNLIMYELLYIKKTCSFVLINGCVHYYRDDTLSY